MNTGNKSFYSNGKILLTGEYMVLFGARALAFPVVYGQEMNVIANDSKIINWKAYSQNNIWFYAEYESDTLNIIAASDSEKAIFLQNLLKKLLKKNKSLFEKGISVTTRTNFPVEWGLGSSSTLINNLAQWAETDAFEFFFSVSSGSGYDIACANATNPIIYKRTGNNYPEIQRFDFNNELMKNMYLVYSGQKKATEQHVKEFLLAKKNHSRDIIEISAISDEIVSCNKVSELIRLIENHEEITGRVLLQIPVKQKNFDRFEGAVKSLGAWGGDFYLAVSENDSDYVQPYFEQFGLTTILPFNKTVLY